MVFSLLFPILGIRVEFKWVGLGVWTNPIQNDVVERELQHEIAQFGSGGSNPMKCHLCGVQMGWSWSLDNPIQNMLQMSIWSRLESTWDVLWVISYEFWKVTCFWAAITRGLGTNSTFGAPCPAGPFWLLPNRTPESLKQSELTDTYALVPK